LKENNLIDNDIPFNNETDLKKRPSLNLNSLNNFPLQIDTNSSNNQKTINNNNINIYGLSYENPFLRNRNSAKPPINISSGNTINNINNSRTSLSQRTQTPSYFSIKKKNKNKLKTFAGDPTDKTLLENHGMRVRYEDYTTIGKYFNFFFFMFFFFCFFFFLFFFFFFFYIFFFLFVCFAYFVILIYIYIYINL